MDVPPLYQSPWAVDPGAFPTDGTPDQQARFLLRYAILAPSSHNAQPWEFAIADGRIEVYLAQSRWLSVADHDKRELHVSVGCAIENLALAARHFGFAPAIEYRIDEASGHVGTVELPPNGEYTPTEQTLFGAITARKTAHSGFDDRTLESEPVEQLQAVIDGTAASLRVITETDLKASIARLQAAADERLMDDPAYRKELGRWIGSGALGASWPMARVGQLAITYLDFGDREGSKNAAHIRDAAAVGLLETSTDDRVAQLETGRAYQRLSLLAASEGLATHPLSQILEVPEFSEDLAALVGSEQTPQHLFRIGYPEASEDHTPRFPLDAVVRSQSQE